VWPGLRPFGRRLFLHEMDQPGMPEALAELRAVLDERPGRYAVGEPMLADPARATSYCGNRALHQAFDFSLAKCRWNARACRAAIERWLRVQPPSGWPCWVLGNHDLHRLATRIGGRHPDDAARVAAALLLTQRGTPFIYYGEELALPDVRLRRGQILDPLGRTFWPLNLGRDGCRAPMPWTDGPEGGFTTGTPWLPLHPGYPGRNVEAQRRDPRSVWSFYRDLIALRRSSPALRRGSFEMLGQPSRRGLAWLRSLEGDQALVALNFRASRLRLGLRGQIDPAGWTRALSAYPDREASLESGFVDLGPYQAVVFQGRRPGQEPVGLSPAKKSPRTRERFLGSVNYRK
jgi:alpha-glucosidase